MRHKGKKKGRKAHRKATPAQLRSLAKAQEAQGNTAAAAKLRAKANKGGGSRTSNPSKGKGKGSKRRTSNPSKSKARKASSSWRTSNPSKGKGKGSKRRTSNPDKGKARKGPGRRVMLTITTSGKGGNRKVKANISQLRAATKGSGRRYLDVTTGQFKRANEINRSKNPSIGSGGILALGAGVVAGTGIAEGMYRFLATRPGAYGETKRDTGWTGRDAMMRINAGSGKCLLFVGVAGVLVGAAGFAMLGSMPAVGGFVLGVGLAHVGVAAGRSLLMLVGKTAKADETDSIANRIAPEFAELEAAYKAQIESANTGATTTESATTPPAGAVSGIEETRRRIQQARAARGGASPRVFAGIPKGSPVAEQIEQAKRQAFAGLGEDPPAVGCDGSCKAGSSCGPDCCNHKRDREERSDLSGASSALPVEPPAPPAPPALPAPTPAPFKMPAPYRAPSFVGGPMGNVSRHLRKVG